MIQLVHVLHYQYFETKKSILNNRKKENFWHKTQKRMEDIVTENINRYGFFVED